jgi:hypothetical protein
MKFLCLHGAYGSAEVCHPSRLLFASAYTIAYTACPQNFQVQLAPFIDAVQKSGKGSFKWINGGHKAVPPTGFDDYFGTPPLFRFMEFDGVEGLGDMLEKVRDFPEGMSAEDTIRQLVGDDQMWTGKAVRSTLDRLFEIIDSDPEIDVRLFSSINFDTT